MKKIALALISLIVISVIYYITIGSKQLTVEIQKEVNKELVQLKESGFDIKEQNLSDNKEKVILTFQDTDKITAFLNNQGQEINKKNLKILKDMQLGMDIEYNPTIGNAIAMDIYPIKFPTSFYQNLDKKDKIELEKMIKEKLLFAHININKLISNFDGYLKDIDKEFKDKENTHIIVKGFKFKGDIKDKKIKNIKQILDKFSFNIDNKLNINITDFVSNTKDIDTEKYSNIEYSMKSLDIINKTDSPFNIKANNIIGISKDTIKENLLNSKSQVKIDSIDFIQNSEKIILSSIIINTSIKNVNKKALEKLEKLSPTNNSTKQIRPLLKEIFKEDISIDIPNISIGKITKDGKSFDGFKIRALVKAEKDFDWKSLDNNPLAVTKLFDAKVNIEASTELMSIISSNPQMMVMMMVIQPIDKNGKKYYDIEFNKGELKINGKPFM